MNSVLNLLTNEDADWLLSIPDSDLESWLTAKSLAHQKAILQQLATHQTAAERATATPAEFAEVVSKGTAQEWKTARHLEILNRELMEIATGANKRLIVEMPPRHGKSFLCSQFFPAWYKGRFPDRHIIVTSATDDLATDFSAAARDLVDEHGPSLFGVRVREDRRAAHRWATEGGGDVRAAGVCGGIMGRGCSLLLIDDYFKNVEEALSETYRRRVHQWYHSTSTTRLTADGSIVIIATRWHADDLIGRVLKEAEITGEQWRRISFPALGDDGAALWPEMFSAEWLQAKRASYYASGYAWMWEALYQQQPPTVLDSEFDAAYFDGDDIWFGDWPPEDEILWRVLVLDPSLGKTDKSDYSAFVMLALHQSGRMFVDADLQRRDSVRIVQDGIGHCRTFFPHVFGCEFNGFQELLGVLWWPEATRNGVLLPVKGIHNHDNKRVRIRRLTEYLAQRRIVFRSHSPGVSLLLEQLKCFPSHKYDDGPDALEMGVRLLEDLGIHGMGGYDEGPVYEQVYS